MYKSTVPNFKKRIFKIIISNYHLRLDKMTSRVKPVVLGKLDVANNKAPTSCAVLQIKFKM